MFAHAARNIAAINVFLGALHSSPKLILMYHQSCGADEVQLQQKDNETNKQGEKATRRQGLGGKETLTRPMRQGGKKTSKKDTRRHGN